MRGRRIAQEKPMPYVDLEVFQDKSSRVLIKLNNAFVGLQQLEPRIQSIQLEEGKELVVAIDDLGEYRFVAEQNDKTVYMSSPVAGIFKYYYEEDSQMWTSNKDGHFMLENLSRELAGLTKGYLDL